MIKYIILFAVLLVVIYIGYKKYKELKDAFKFDFGIESVSGNILGFISGNAPKSLTVKFFVTISNISKSSISFSDLVIKLYTPDGFQIGESPLTADNLKTTVLNPTGNGLPYRYTGTLEILINGTTVNIGTAIMTGQTVRINYTVTVKVTMFKIPVTIKNYIDYKK